MRVSSLNVVSHAAVLLVGTAAGVWWVSHRPSVVENAAVASQQASAKAAAASINRASNMREPRSLLLSAPKSLAEFLQQLAACTTSDEAMLLSRQVAGVMDLETVVAWCRALPSEDGQWHYTALRCFGEKWAKSAPEAAWAWLLTLSTKHAEEAISDMVTAMASVNEPVAVARVKALPAGDVRDSALLALGTVVAKRDPLAGLAFIEASEYEYAHYTVRAVLQEWAGKDLDAALRYTATMKGAYEKKAALESVVEGVSPHEERLWDALQHLPPGDPGREVLPDLLGRIAAKDPQLAAAGLQKLRGSAYDDGLAKVVKAWAEKDRVAVLAWIQKEVPRAKRAAAFDGFSSQIEVNSQADLTTLMQLATAMPEAEQSALLYSIFSNNYTLDWEEKAHLLENLDPEMTREAEQQVGILSSVASEDPDRALRLLQRLDANGEQWGEALSAMLATDKVKAQAAWDQLPVAMKADAAEDFLGELAASDPKLALQKLESMTPAAGQGIVEYARSAIFSKWAELDAEGLLAWSQTAPTPEMGAAAKGLAIAGLMEQGYAAAESHLTRFTIEEQRSEAYQAAVEEFLPSAVLEKPLEMANWALAQVVPENRLKFIAQVTEEWVEDAPQDASRWVADLPEGEVKLIAVESLVDSIAHEDPSGAMAWLGSMPQGERRESAWNHFFKEWHESNPQQAVSALEAAPIAPGTRQGLLNALAK